MLKLKDRLVKTTAVKLAVPERIVDAVITHQFASANSAMDGSNETVELSGFGKFTFSYKKAQKRMEKMEKIVAELEAINNPSTRELTKLTTYQRLIKQLKPIIENAKF